MKELKFYVSEGEGENATIKEVSLEKFASTFAKENNVPDYEDGGLDSDKVSEGLFNMAAAGADLPDDIADYAKYYDLAKQAMLDSTKLGDQMKKDAEAKKAEADQKAKEAKEKKEQEKKELEGRRNVFLDAAMNAANGANDQLRRDLEEMRDALPTGVSFHITDTNGFGMTFSDDAKEEDLASALGYFVAQERNTELKKSAYQFCIGEIANELMKRGIYPSMIQCGRALSDKLSAQGIKLGGRNIESYGRMADRIPEELRNPAADPTAYLAISDMPYPKKPNKADFTEKAEFETAMKDFEAAKKAVDERRLELAGYLKAGFIKEVVDGKPAEIPMLTRRDILPLIEASKVNLGLKAAPDPDKKSAAHWLRQYFEASEYGNLFEGIHAKGKVRVHPKEGDGTQDFTAAELVEMKEEALNNLIPVFFGDKLAALKAGEEDREVQVYEEKDGKQVAKKDDKGALVKEKKTFKVYPRMYSVE